MTTTPGISPGGGRYGAMVRLDADRRQSLLDHNEGFRTSSYYEGKNFRESRTYTIDDGELHIHESGKTSWADSRYSGDRIAGKDETHRFLRTNQHLLDTDIDAGSKPERFTRSVIDPKPATPKAPTDDTVGSDEDSDDQKRDWVVPALVVTAVVLVTGVVVFKYGKPVWNNQVKPAAAKLKSKLTRSDCTSRDELDEQK
jgi:hypothetical protein